MTLEMALFRTKVPTQWFLAAHYNQLIIVLLNFFEGQSLNTLQYSLKQFEVVQLTYIS